MSDFRSDFENVSKLYNAVVSAVLGSGGDDRDPTRIIKKWFKKRASALIGPIGFLAVMMSIAWLMTPSGEVMMQEIKARRERVSLVEQPLRELGFDIVKTGNRSRHWADIVLPEDDYSFYYIAVVAPKGSCVVPFSKVVDAYEKEPSGKLLLLSYYPTSLEPECRAYVTVVVQTQNKYLEIKRGGRKQESR